MSIKVLIADDHDMVRKGVRSWLEAESDIIVIDEARKGQEALESKKPKTRCSHARSAFAGYAWS
jgi:YesN/AraC family two-component response regulator